MFARLCVSLLALASMTATAQEPVRVYAAGSLRAPLSAIAETFTRAHGTKVELTFGASGLLRDRIAGGERADVFASANTEHPDALVARGWARTSTTFARNEMCILASAQVPVTTENALDTLLDPKWRVGTSTPLADPSGDYAWQVFRRADAVRPGAFAALEAKARMLTGGPQSPPPPADGNVYAAFVGQGDADLFLTYCTNARAAMSELPSLRSVALPANLSVGARYGVAMRADAAKSAAEFLALLLSPEGQRTLAQFGFAAP